MPAQATKRAKPPESGAGTGSSKPRKDEPFLDMMVLAHPRDLAKARVRSLFAEAVTAAPAKQRDGEKSDDQLAAALEEARKKHPEDLGLAICEALRAMAGNDPARQAPAVARLVGLLEKTPLEALGAGERADARQRALAARQIPLWLVARACWSMKDDPDAAKLAELVAPRALEAARRQTDNTFYLAMVREQGERALEKGDRAGALAAWGRMLDIVVNPPQNKAKKAGPVPARHERTRRRASAGDEEGGGAESGRGRAGAARAVPQTGVVSESGAREGEGERSSGRDWQSRGPGGRRCRPGGRSKATGADDHAAARRCRQGCCRQASRRGRGSIGLVDPHARSVRAGHADRAAGGRARPARALPQGRARLIALRAAGRAGEQ